MPTISVSLKHFFPIYHLMQLHQVSQSLLSIETADAGEILRRSERDSGQAVLCVFVFFGVKGHFMEHQIYLHGNLFGFHGCSWIFRDLC